MTDKQVHRLTLDQHYKLITCVKRHYKELKLNNARFAEHAGKELGFRVTPQQVASSLKILNIRPTIVHVQLSKEVIGSSRTNDKRSLTEQFEDLRARVVVLEAFKRQFEG